MLRQKDLTLVESRKALTHIPEGKVLINTINTHSFNTAQNDDLLDENRMTTHAIKRTELAINIDLMEIASINAHSCDMAYNGHIRT